MCSIARQPQDGCQKGTLNRMISTLTLVTGITSNSLKLASVKYFHYHIVAQPLEWEDVLQLTQMS